ncbi:MAG: hypothetical protein LBH76_10855, partial [Propionibacteriaceae bacterium]|nr:hypothetical protein [Propionibacteriaceae bacterium]
MRIEQQPHASLQSASVASSSGASASARAASSNGCGHLPKTLGGEIASEGPMAVEDFTVQMAFRDRVPRRLPPAPTGSADPAPNHLDSLRRLVEGG